jgi:hypothetical protein
MKHPERAPVPAVDRSRSTPDPDLLVTIDLFGHTLDDGETLCRAEPITVDLASPMPSRCPACGLLFPGYLLDAMRRGADKAMVTR